MRSPKILAVSWAACRSKDGAGKDLKLLPGGGREWQKAYLWPGCSTRPADVLQCTLVPGHRNGLRDDLPPPALPGSGPGGRRPASPLPASQPFRRASGPRGRSCGPAPSLASQAPQRCPAQPKPPRVEGPAHPGRTSVFVAVLHGDAVTFCTEIARHVGPVCTSLSAELLVRATSSHARKTVADPLARDLGA